MDSWQARILDMWLWRLYKFFEMKGRRLPSQSPPPVILVYLWDSGLKYQVNQSAFRAQASVVEHYRRAGWSISIVNVGGAITLNNGAILEAGVGQLLDDYHHPGCAGVHLISAMLRHVLYTDIRHCHDSNRSPKQALEPMTKPLLSEHKIIESAVWKALLGHRKVGSLMKWKPQAGTSLLTIADEYANRSSKALKASKGRHDRKIPYTLPVCPETAKFVLIEPSLEWLGLGLGSGDWSASFLPARHAYSLMEYLYLQNQPPTRCIEQILTNTNRQMDLSITFTWIDGFVLWTLFLNQPKNTCWKSAMSLVSNRDVLSTMLPA